MADATLNPHLAAWLEEPDSPSSARVASLRTAAYFNVGDRILFGKYKNKKGIIVRFYKDDRGIPMAEVEPIPKGRKKNHEISLFKFWHSDFEKRAGRLVHFPTPARAVRPKHTITIAGKKYALSDDSGWLADLVGDPDEGHADGYGPRVIKGPAHSQPFRYLWVYDTDRGDVGMWRTTDGNEKAYGGADNFRAKIMKLDAQGELNRVPTSEMRAVERAMRKLESEHFQALQSWVKKHETEYQKIVNRVALEVFDKAIAPTLVRRLSELRKGVVPFGFKVIESILEHEDEAAQMRGHVISEEAAKFTPELVETELRRRGIDPGAEGHDIQAAYWAIGDIRDEAWRKYKRASSSRVARRFQAETYEWDNYSMGEWTYLIRGELDDGMSKVEEWELDDNQWEVIEGGDGPQVALLGGSFNDLDWFVSQHNTDLFYRHPEDKDGDWQPLSQHYGGKGASSSRVSRLHMAGTWDYEPWADDRAQDDLSGVLKTLKIEPATAELWRMRGVAENDDRPGVLWCWVGTVYEVGSALHGVPASVVEEALKVVQGLPNRPGYMEWVSGWEDSEKFISALQHIEDDLAEHLSKAHKGTVWLYTHNIDWDSKRVAAGRAARRRVACKLLPVSEPLHNMREIAKQMVLLEDHLFQPRKRCMDCVRKHLLTIEALAEEVASLVTADLDPKWAVAAEMFAEIARMAQVNIARGGDLIEIAQGFRTTRKNLVGKLYAPGSPIIDMINMTDDQADSYREEMLERSTVRVASVGTHVCPARVAAKYLRARSMTLYRATKDSTARSGAHFTEELQDAVKYTNNPGFGGPQVYSYRVNPRRALDAEGRGGREDLAEAYMETLSKDDLEDLHWDIRRSMELYDDDEVTPEPRDLADMWGSNGFIKVFHVLENVRDVQEVVAKKYDWISYTDDFPPGSTTWKFLGKGSVKPTEMLYDRATKRGGTTHTARKVVLDEVVTKEFRKEFLMIQRNLGRINDLDTAQEFRRAVRKWGGRFEDFGAQIRADLESRKRDRNITDDAKKWAQYYLDNMKPFWEFSSEFNLRVPSIPDAKGDNEDEVRARILSNPHYESTPEEVDRYIEDAKMRGVIKTQAEAEALALAKWKEEARKWDARTKRKALPAWKYLLDASEWAAREGWYGGKDPVVLTDRVTENVELAGFKMQFVGFDDAGEYTRKHLGTFKRGLAHYRQRAGRVLPWLIQHQLPMVVRWDITSGIGRDEAASYHGRTIEVLPWGLLADSDKDIARVLAHEMAHHLFQTGISSGARKFWNTVIRGDYTDLDLRDILKVDGDMFNTSWESQHPLLALQWQTMNSAPAYKRLSLYSAKSIQEYLDSGGDPKVRVPAHPISWYAGKNPEEAFCEAVGHVVGLGPRSIPEIARGWLRTVLPSIKIAGEPPPTPEPTRVAAKFQKKKKVKKQDGDEMTVYEYSDGQVAHRDREKAKRVEKLRKSIGKLRSQVKKDLSSKKPETRLAALAVALLDETFERVGNDDSAKDGHFGVTGWRVEHITFKGSTATFKYVGKSGVDQEKKVTNAKVVSALKAVTKGKDAKENILCEDDGTCRVTSSEVNSYLKPFDITAKDIRGLHANEEMKNELKKVRSGKLPTDKKKREKQLKDEFNKALEAAASAVGHEPSTLKSQYLVPGLEEDFLKDGTVSDKHTKTGSAYEEPCPVCGELATAICKCRVGERGCPNNHNWASCPVHGVPVVLAAGANTHAVPAGSCLCGMNKTGSPSPMLPKMIPPGIYAKTAIIGFNNATNGDHSGLLDLNAFTARLATKSDAEKEDAEADKLIRKKPKKKPPRKDLHNRVMNDPDDDDDGDAKQDRKDQSQNWKDGSVMAAWSALADRVAKPTRRQRKKQKQKQLAAPQVAPATEVKTHQPGDTWKPEGSDTWSAKGKNDEGKIVTQGKFKSQDDAKAWLAGGVAPGEDDKAPEDAPEDAPKDAPKDKAPEDDKAPEEDKDAPEDDKAPEDAPEEDKDAEEEMDAEEMDAAIKEVTKLTKKLLSPNEKGGVELPSGFKDKVTKKLKSMKPAGREKFMESMAIAIAKFPKNPPMGVEAIVAGREAVDADLTDMSPAAAGKALANAFYAERVTFNPLMLNGRAVSEETEASTAKELAEQVDRNIQRSLAAKAYYSEMDAENREDALKECDEALRNLHEDSPRALEIQSIKNGISMAAILRGEDPPGVEVSEQFVQLASAMAAIGEENRLLGSVQDFTSPDAQDVVRSALGTMTDREIAEYIGGTNGDHPMASIADAMLKRDDDGNFVLNDADRIEMRKWIEDSIIEDIALLDPLIGDYLEASGQENTRKARDEFRKKHTAPALEKVNDEIKKFFGATDEVDVPQGIDNEDRESTKALAAELAKASGNRLEGVFEATIDETENLDGEASAIARAVRKEKDPRAIHQRRIDPSKKNVTHKPGEVWGSRDEWFGQTPEGDSVGPLKSKEKAESWARGDVGGDLKKASEEHIRKAYHMTPWREFGEA